MKVRIKSDIDAHFPMWYSRGHAGKEYEVVSQLGEKGFFVKAVKPDAFIYSQHCDVVSGDSMDFLKHRMTEEKVQEILEAETKSNMKQIKMSVDTARAWYKLAKENNADGITTPVISWLLENFTKEELEPKKGFTWEESFDRKGYYIDNASSIINLEHVCSDGVSFDGNKNVFKTHEQAESTLAFAQLSHIVAKYNEGKNLEGIMFSVYPSSVELLWVCVDIHNYLGISFNLREDALTSMEVNRELWEQYWLIKK